MLNQTARKHVAHLAGGRHIALANIPADGLFLPGETPDITALLLETLWRRRQASFLAGALTILQACPALADQSGFAAVINSYRQTPMADRRAMMEHPSFRIWLGHMTRLPRLDLLDNEDQATLRTLLIDGTRLVNAGPGPNFALQRFDLDPLLAAAIPPSYNFDDVDSKRRREPANPYSLEFANEVVGVALYRIGQIWPEARLGFYRFVKRVIHLPDLESRSCSAARFAGAILLSSGDDTLLAVEESLIHEYGHQVLYCIMELDPLIHDTARRSFTLPWSGSQRDAYGYFHATYIYLILALFYERVVDSAPDDRQCALFRLAEILKGLDQALNDLIGANFFTETGRSFFDRLNRCAVELIERNRHCCPDQKQEEKHYGSDASHSAATTASKQRGRCRTRSSRER